MATPNVIRRTDVRRRSDNDAMQCNVARGFTLIELVLVITIIVSVTGIMFPRVQGTILQASVRGARLTVQTELAAARGAAVNRGCPAMLHIRSGSNGRMWITTCPMTGLGIDTVGSIQSLSVRYGVNVNADWDSIGFAPTGLAYGSTWRRVHLDRSGHADSLRISPVGRTSW